MKSQSKGIMTTIGLRISNRGSLLAGSLRAARLVFAAGMLLSLASSAASACPFCQAFRSPIANDLRNAKVAVIADFANLVPFTANDKSKDEGVASQQADFRIQRVIKGHSELPKTTSTIRLSGDTKFDTSKTYLCVGFGTKTVAWATPIPLNRNSVGYLEKLSKLPESGPARLEFFLKHLDDADPTIADDAYNEFALASYDDLLGLQDKIDRKWMLELLQRPRTDEMRLRLFCTLLGVAGNPEDAPSILALMTRLEQQSHVALDAAVACYLTLLGEEGLSEVRSRYLANVQAAPRNVYSAIVAVSFQGDQLQKIERPKLAESLELVLDRHEYADLVILKLAQWEHWSAAKRIAQLFKEADPKATFVRQPAVRFLRACPKPEAAALLRELESIDPQAVAQSQSFQPIPPPDESEEDDDVKPAPKPVKVGAKPSAEKR